MSRPSSRTDSQVSRPRRRGAENQTQTAQTTAASAGEAPVLLRLPDMTDQVAGAVAAPGAIAHAAPESGAEPIAEAFATTTVGMDLANESGRASADVADADYEYDEDDERGSSEIRDRRRKRRERQEQVGPPIWSTTSGRVTIAGGVVLLGLLAAIVLAPGNTDEPESDWDDSIVVAEDQGQDYVQVTPPVLTAATEGSEAWAGPDASTTVPEPTPPPYVAVANEDPNQGVIAAGEAQVQTSYENPPPFVAQSTYAESQGDAYATPATHIEPGEPGKAYIAEDTSQDANQDHGQFKGSGSPGVYLPTPRVASNVNTNQPNTNAYRAPPADSGQGAATVEPTNTPWQAPPQQVQPNRPYATPYAPPAGGVNTPAGGVNAPANTPSPYPPPANTPPSYNAGSRYSNPPYQAPGGQQVNPNFNY